MIAWILDAAEQTDVEFLPMPAWAELAYAALGRWGVFAFFAVPGGLLILGGVLSLTSLLPGPLQRITERVLGGLLTTTVTVGFMAGGLAGAFWLFQSGHWFFAGLLVLLAIVGLVFTLGMLGQGEIGATLAVVALVAAVTLGVPLAAGYWSYERWLAHDDRWMLGAALCVLALAIDLFIAVGYVQNKLRADR